MEPDRKHPIFVECAAQKQPADDVAHLRRLWASLQRTESVLLRATAAYEESRRLLQLVQMGGTEPLCGSR